MVVTLTWTFAYCTDNHNYRTPWKRIHTTKGLRLAERSKQRTEPRTLPFHDCPLFATARVYCARRLQSSFELKRCALRSAEGVNRCAHQSSIFLQSSHVEQFQDLLASLQAANSARDVGDLSLWFVQSQHHRKAYISCMIPCETQLIT
jgi:hypothetical protein